MPLHISIPHTDLSAFFGRMPSVVFTTADHGQQDLVRYFSIVIKGQGSNDWDRVNFITTIVNAMRQLDEASSH